MAADLNGWGAFAEYLTLRASGRRRDALQTLDELLPVAERWPFEDRRAFVEWIGLEYIGSHRRSLMPEPLARRIITPTSVEWLAREPDSGTANFFFAIFGPRDPAPAMGPLDYLRRAVAIDPANELARQTFIDRVVACVENSQHELPSFGYLGSASEDLSDLDDAVEMLTGLHEPNWRPGIDTQLNELRETAKAWHQFEEESPTVNFATWCKDRGGPAHLLQWIR